jgi:hypothetical protein
MKTVITMTLVGGLVGALIGMAFAAPFECDKKYGKATLIYLACIITMSLVFVAPLLIICM